MQHHLIEAFLECGGHVAMLIRDRGFRRSERNEMILEITTSCSIILAIFTSLAHTQERNPDPAVLEECDGLLEERPKPRRVAIASANPMILYSSELKSKPR